MNAVDYQNSDASPRTGTDTGTDTGASAHPPGTPAKQSASSRGLSGARLSLLIVLVILLAILWIGPNRVGAFASRMLQAYLQAQQTMLEATSNRTADGRAEFAVLLSEGANADDMRSAMTDIDDVEFTREADLPGWVVVTTKPGNRSGLDALLALPQSRMVVPNRGLWICH